MGSVPSFHSFPVAYSAKEGNKWFVVVDGKEQKHYDITLKGGLLFSPDSKHVAYGVLAGKKQFVVVDGKEGKQYDGIVHNGGGTVIFDSPNTLLYLVLKGSSIYLVEEKLK